jgi:hypothetical protein
VGRGDEADEEAALADGRVPDEQDLEGAVVAAGRRRRHALRRRPRADQRALRIESSRAEQSRAEESSREWRGRGGLVREGGRTPRGIKGGRGTGKGSIDRWRKAKAKRAGVAAGVGSGGLLSVTVDG